MAKAEYMGGHPHMRKQVEGQLSIGINAVNFSYGLLGKLHIPFEDIRSMSALTEEQISRNVTLTRFLLIGVFAFAAQKKRVDKTPYLTIDCVVNGVETSVIFKDPDAHKHNAHYYALKEAEAKRAERLEKKAEKKAEKAEKKAEKEARKEEKKMAKANK